MKITIDWLSDWITTGLDTKTMVETLTMAGLEVDSVEPVSPEIKKLVVGQVESVDAHPNADKLKVCKVNVGLKKSVQIVCGANNVAEGLWVPVALVGCTLPGGMTIKPAELRGVQSSGMLCSAAELGLEEESAGLLLLDGKLTPGTDISELLKLNDTCIDIDLTPNRGDCLSIRGIARELSALTGKKLKARKPSKIKIQSKKIVSLKLAAKKECPRYFGRVVEGINESAKTPLWMKERLRRCGIRAIHPVVDITNYVMLELGQPMHGFDLDKLNGPISVRLSKKGEQLELLDGQNIKVQDKSLLIADRNGPLALAGIMGGQYSSVTDSTVNIFLESAFFNADAIAGRARKVGLHTDSSHRFERGVDPELQQEAIEYATELLLSIAGGKAGKLVKAESKEHLPQRSAIALNKQQVIDLLGISLTGAKIESYLGRLGMKVTRRSASDWRVRAPSYRFDINREVDLIEEVARLYGYVNLPIATIQSTSEMRPIPDGVLKDQRIRSALVDRGYFEVITYSFIDPELQVLISPDAVSPRLNNPIAEDMAQMRASLWPGLMSTAIYNLNRQQGRVRIFELGTCFSGNGKAARKEHQMLAGLIAGADLPEQWAANSREVDFFDLKGDLEAVVSLAGLNQEMDLKPTTNKGIHPGQGADIHINGVLSGSIGRVHPAIESKLGINKPIFVFELELSALKDQKVPKFSPLSRFPTIRRDIAVVINNKIPASNVLDCIRSNAGALLIDLELFDEYRGEGIDSGRKSLALGLILQDSSRTLKEQVVETVVSSVVDALRKEFGAELRT